MKTSKKANKVPLLGVSGHKWEYLVKTHSRDFNDTQKMLNEYGKLGWELCSVETMGNGWSDYIFKRMKS